MRILYTASISIYKFAIWLIAPFNEKAKKWINGRKKWQKRLSENIPKNSNVVWFHCASLGEFEQGRSVIEAYRKARPNDYIVLTFFSPSGYEIRKNYSGADLISYLPADTISNAKEFIRLTQPKAVYFVKYEFWFNYLIELKKNNINTFLISGIFRTNQHFFKWYGGWFRNQLSSFSHFFLQNEASANLLKTINYSNLTVCGDTRFDRVNQLVSTAKPVPSIEQFIDNQFTIIAGSTWPKDEELLKDLITTYPNTRLIIAPHEITANRLTETKKLFGEQAGFFTKGEFNQQVLILDTIGMLSSIYRYGQWAYIGGGFGNGIHNTLEAASYGVPVVFGPHYQKFQEAKDLIKLNAGHSITSIYQLKKVAELFYANNEERKRQGMAAKNYVEKNLGATKKIILTTVKKLQNGHLS